MHRGNIVWSILLCSLIDMLISKLCSAEFHCVTKCIYQFSVAVIAEITSDSLRVLAFSS